MLNANAHPGAAAFGWRRGRCSQVAWLLGKWNNGAPIAVSASEMLKFLIWCLLFVVCWPLALLALILYPFVWLITLPFRLVGIAVGGVFALLKALLYLPARVLAR